MANLVSKYNSILQSYKNNLEIEIKRDLFLIYEEIGKGENTYRLSKRTLSHIKKYYEYNRTKTPLSLLIGLSKNLPKSDIYTFVNFFLFDLALKSINNILKDGYSTQYTYFLSDDLSRDAIALYFSTVINQARKEIINFMSKIYYRPVYDYEISNVINTMFSIIMRNNINKYVELCLDRKRK